MKFQNVLDIVFFFFIIIKKTRILFRGVFFRRLLNRRLTRSRFRRVFWTITVACAVLLAAYAIVESWMSYNRSSIDTVVETTFFNYADIAFPMVVICDNSRVDWQRVTRLTAK